MAIVVMLSAGCVSVSGEHPGYHATSLKGNYVLADTKLPEDPEELPGYRRTIVGKFADFGFGLVGTPVMWLIGYPVMCVSDDEDLTQGVVYPFGFIGAFAFAAPVVVLKFVFYDVPTGFVWLLKSEKGKVDYYISHINDLSESEFRHLVELTGRNFGDVSRKKGFLYSWGIPDKGACEQWRAWWKASGDSPLEDLRQNSNQADGP